MRLIAPNIIRLLRHVCSHDPGQTADPLIPDLPSEGPVHLAQTHDIEHYHCGRMVKIVRIFRRKAPEILPMLEPCQRVCTEGGIGKHEKVSGDASAVVPKPPVVAAHGAAISSPCLTLNTELVFFADLLRKRAKLQKPSAVHFFRKTDVRQQPLRPLVVHDELLVVIEEHDALVDVLEDRHRQGLKHIVLPIVERRPIHQVDAEAVSDDGVVELCEDRTVIGIKKHRVHQNDEHNSQNVEGVLIAILPRGTDGFIK